MGSKSLTGQHNLLLTWAKKKSRSKDCTAGDEIRPTS